MPKYIVAAVYIEQYQVEAESEDKALLVAETLLGSGKQSLCNWHAQEVK